jgi:hypothetical protein
MTVVPAEKECWTCLTVKPLSDFHRDAHGRYGRHSACRECMNAKRRDGSHVNVHGYAGYANGCRCDICRTAKNGYIRARRAEARLAAPEATAAGVTHGTRHAYEERGCRCVPCCNAQRDRRAADDARRKARRAEVA